MKYFSSILYKNSNRTPYFDTLKFLSILLVCFTHFIDKFNNSYFLYWKEFPTKIFIQGITGKLGVAIFAVISGFLSFKKSKQSILLYSIKRYCYFFFIELLVNIILCSEKNISFVNALLDALKIGNSVFPTFWFMRDFLFASFLSFYFAKKDLSIYIKIVIIIIFHTLNLTWIAICLYGSLIHEIQSYKIFSYLKYRILLIILFYFAIQRPETNFTYILDGIFALIVICVVQNSINLRQVLQNKYLSFFGKRTMAILVIHPVVYDKIGIFLFKYFPSNGFCFFSIFFVLMIIICILSLPLDYIFSSYYSLIKKLLNKLEI